MDKLTIKCLIINGADLIDVYEVAEGVWPPRQVGRPTPQVGQPPLMAGGPSLLTGGYILRLE
jgi:hypothetical protein